MWDCRGIIYSLKMWPAHTPTPYTIGDEKTSKYFQPSKNEEEKNPFFTPYKKMSGEKTPQVFPPPQKWVSESQKIKFFQNSHPSPFWGCSALTTSQVRGITHLPMFISPVGRTSGGNEGYIFRPGGMTEKFFPKYPIYTTFTLF